MLGADSYGNRSEPVKAVFKIGEQQIKFFETHCPLPRFQFSAGAMNARLITSRHPHIVNKIVAAFE